LRKHKSGLAIIGLSANVTREALQEAQEAGMQDYMTKPFSRKRLVEILNNYLDQSSMEEKFSKRG
jgi:CheY-like chemotaxis protein